MDTVCHNTAVIVRSPSFDDLSADVLDFILRKLTWVGDYINFSAVCRTWRWVAAKQKDYRTMNSSYHPLLILPYYNSGDPHRKIYSFGESRVYADKITIPTPYSDRQYYCGSMFGWLAFAEDDCGITLIKPFSNSPHIHLPPMMQVPLPPYDDEDILHPELFINKVLISADPSTHPLDYVVAVIFDYFNYMYGAFIRSGEARWTGIDKSFKGVSDIVFSNGRLLAIDCYQQLISIDYNSSTLLTSVAEEDTLTGDVAVMQYLVSRGPSDFDVDLCYIVDMGGGELLHVKRFFHCGEHDQLFLKTVEFKVYKLQNSDWVEIHDIGNHVLFLGTNSSICTSSTSSFRPNSIYYTDDVCCRYPHGSDIFDMGVFDIKTKIIDTLYALPPNYDPTCFFPTSIWILPML